MLLDHVDMRVRNLAAVRPLYDALLAAMGYTKWNVEEDAVGYHWPDETGVEQFIWVVQSTDHLPGGTRVAFAAQTRAEVDRLAEVARNAGATAFEAPQLDEEPNYYATFFEDAEGNKLEIVCRRPE